MFCPNCGKNLSENAKYCIECGEKLPTPDNTEETVTTSETTPSESEVMEDAIPLQKDAAPTAEAAPPQQQPAKTKGFTTWFNNNPLRGVLILIGALLGILIITIIVTGILSIAHYSNNYDIDHEDYGYYEDYGNDYDNYDDNSQWYDETQREWEEESKNTIEDIGATVPEGQSVSYGKVLRHAFYSGEWDYDSPYDDFGTDTAECTYEGLCLYNGKITDTTVSFIQGEDGTYEVGSVIVAGKTLNSEEITAFIDSLYQSYNDDNATESPQS